jgi:translation initiation factor eIF-2B subunit delta
MDLHLSVQNVLRRLQAGELHAARSGREVVHALNQLVADSQAADGSALAIEVEESAAAILSVMPAYAPPLNVINRSLACLEKGLDQGDSLAGLKARLADEFSRLIDWAQESPERLARFAAELIQPGMTIYTHTLSETVMRVFRTAWDASTIYRVLVSESQPNRDGLITARQLASLGVEVEIGLDAGIGEMLARADLMLTGTEAITPGGSAICKVGTYPAALMAREYGVPFYVVADTLKFIPAQIAGFSPASNPITFQDILPGGEKEAFAVTGHLFDETPPALIRGIVTETGLIHPLACAYFGRRVPVSERMERLLFSWTGARA